MPLPSRILIACSDREWTRTLSNILESWGAEVVCKDTLGETRKFLSEQTVSLVFCEQTLADGSFRDLLTAGTRTPPVRVIVMIHDEKDYSEALRCGAFDAIPIPCRRSEVQWMVINALRDQDIPPLYPEHHMA